MEVPKYKESKIRSAAINWMMTSTIGTGQDEMFSKFVHVLHVASQSFKIVCILNCLLFMMTLKIHACNVYTN